MDCARIGRHAGPDGLVHGEEWISGYSTCQPLSLGSSFITSAGYSGLSLLAFIEYGGYCEEKREL